MKAFTIAVLKKKNLKKTLFGRPFSFQNKKKGGKTGEKLGS